MKKINKSDPPNPLTQFAEQFPQGNWNDFRNFNQSQSYLQTRQRLIDDQQGLCGFCEKNISKLGDHHQRIEHFHSKSDLEGQHNWALDWFNIFAVCTGGSRWSPQESNKNYLRPQDLSCDAYKDRQIRTNELPIACEGHLLNPLTIATSPNLFKLNKANGHLEPHNENCKVWLATDNNYQTTQQLVAATIKHLNLNCRRLADVRLKILKQYNQQVKKYRLVNDKQGLVKLANHWLSAKSPEFYTTKRCLLGK